MIIFLFIFFFYYVIDFLKLKREKKFFKAKKLKTFNKRDLNKWMNLTKKERYNLLEQESATYLDKRKLLLDEIRKEYEKISKVNSEKNVNEN
jgi:hypothetical protein